MSEPLTSSSVVIPLTSDSMDLQNGVNSLAENARNENSKGRVRFSFHHHHHSFQSKTIKTAFICSMLMNFVFICGLIAVVVGFVFFAGNSTLPFALNSVSNIVCFPCGKAGIPGIRRQDRTDNGFCCVQKDDVDLGLINERKIIPRISAVMDRYPSLIDCEELDIRNKSLKPRRHHEQIAARLVLNTDLLKQGKPKSLKWLTNKSSGFIQGAIDYVNETLCLREDGLMNIVSHFSFDSTNNKLSSGDHVIKHVIFKVTGSKKKDYSKLAYENVFLRERSYQSSELEAMVRLSANECVGVYVSSISSIYDLPVANVFQIVKVGS